jgi:hypothetical protein
MQSNKIPEGSERIGGVGRPERREDAMLDAFIIEEIRRREQERERRDRERPCIQIPVPEPSRAPKQSEDKPQRGVIIIDYSV